MVAAMWLCTPDAFAMTCGVIVPVDRGLIEEVLAEVLPRVRGSPEAFRKLIPLLPLPYQGRNVTQTYLIHR
jgi:hypothetical protein